jgi:hypothetical protein
MSLETTLICEYIFDNNECVEYLKCNDVNYLDYEHIYNPNYYVNNVDKKKKIRILQDVTETDLTEYVNLMKVSFNFEFNNKIQLPPNILHLELNMDLTQKIHIPPNIMYLKSGYCYNHPLPPLLKLHTLQIEWNYSFKITLPKSLKHLIWYNRNELPKLPQGLTHLTFAYAKPCFEQFSNTLTHLSVKYLNTNIIYIPHTITHLTWNNEHKLPLLSNNLTYLSLGDYYSHKINILPDSLTHLLIGPNVIINVFPAKLKYLKLLNKINRIQLSNRLEYLVIGDYDHNNESTKHKFMLPNTLKYLKWTINLRLPELPDSLCMLEYYSSKRRHKIIKLPIHLTCLKWMCNRRLPILPDTLITLELKFDYIHKLPTLPHTLTRLIVSRNYKRINELRELYLCKIIYEY